MYVINALDGRNAVEDGLTLLNAIFSAVTILATPVISISRNAVELSLIL